MSDEECILKSASVFCHANGDLGNLDGNYLFLDSIRGLLIRSGAAETGMRKRFGEHETASKSPGDGNSRFYRKYPHADHLDQDPLFLRRGTFQQLTQLVSIGFKRENKKKLSNLIGLTE